MTDNNDADLVALDAVTANLITAISAIVEAQGSLQTPCDQWNLADLVDHVTGGNWFTIRILAGEQADVALAATMARFGHGPVSTADAVQSATDQRNAFNNSEALDRSWHHVAGLLPGRQILRLRIHDLIVHTWDIGQTLQPPAAVPTNLARWGQHELRNPDSLTSKHFDIPGPVGHRSSAGDVTTAYLEAFGR